jgi:ankyrin repeat protein
LNSSIWTAAQINDYPRVQAIGDTDSERLRRYDKYGYSSLHYAAQGNHVAIVKYLLSKHVAVDGNACGATPLHRAAAAGSYEACKLLVSHGANVDAKDSSFGDNLTPIEKAFKNGHYDLVDLLLPHSTSITREDLLIKFPPILSEKPVETVNENSLSSFEVPEEMLSPILCQPSALINYRVCDNCQQNSLSFFKTSQGSLVCMKCKKNSF